MNLHYRLRKDDYLNAQELFAENSGFAIRVIVYALPLFGVLLIAMALLNIWIMPRAWMPSGLYLPATH